MKHNIANKTGKVVYLSHGGGPMPILGDPGHEKMINFMKDFSKQVGKPDAVIIISAHWEESVFTITGNKKPTFLYDYFGFPAEAYNLTYPLFSSFETVVLISELLDESGMAYRIDDSRGFDHGAFIPMMLMYPEGDVPIIQISLKKGLSPQEHMKLGISLRELMNKNILIMGSGFSFHNMSAFSFGGTEDSDSRNNAFQNWLSDVCSGNYSRAEREKKLLQWEKAPHARYCHPREEHLIPLHVCAGILDKTASVVFDDTILGKRAMAFYWEA